MTRRICTLPPGISIRLQLPEASAFPFIVVVLGSHLLSTGRYCAGRRSFIASMPAKLEHRQ